LNVDDEVAKYGCGVVSSFFVLSTEESQEEVLSILVCNAIVVSGVLLCFLNSLGKLLIKVFGFELFYDDTLLVLFFVESVFLVHQSLKYNMFRFVVSHGDVFKDIPD
jgi:hypothetical protein